MVVEIIGERGKVLIRLPSSSGAQTALVDGRELACDWARLGDGRYSLIIDGHVHDLSVALNGDTCVVTGGAGVHSVRVMDPRRLPAGTTAEPGAAGLQRVCAEMPGKVVRVLVKPGDNIALDEALIVIEAMKMQNEIRAPKTGIVKEVGVAPGMNVSTGDFLASLE